MMKISHRIISIILIAFVFSAQCTFAAESTKDTFEPGEHIETITFLKAVGIFDDDFGTSASSRTVTRGEFAKLIAGIMRTGTTSSYSASFADVPYEHEYAPYIYAVKNAGYMNGTSAYLFAPDDLLSYEQAVSVCVKLAGYEPVALTIGSYPEGYLGQAAKLGILDNVSAAVGAPISRGNLCELIYNTVLCDMMVVDGYGDKGSYTIYDGENILSYYHHIEEGTGIVTADNFYTMTSQYSGYDNAVIINNQKYLRNDPSVLNDSVGRGVRFWYRADGSQRTVLYAKRHETSEVVFGARDGLELDIAAGVYKFYEGDKLINYRLSGTYNVIYNMEELYPVTASKLLPLTGTVTLIDNNDDKLYDVVIVDEFYNLVADMYNKNLNTITDINDTSRSLKLDDYDSYRIFDKSGNSISADKIKLNSVVEVYKAPGGSRITAVVNSTVVSGKYTEKTDDKIKVDGREFKFSHDVRSDISALSLGNEYDFYVNTKNEIVYWTQGLGYKQGYVLDVGETVGLEKTVAVKLLSQTGKVEVFDLADKVKNMNYGLASTVDKTNYNTIFSQTNNREFVLYQLNSEGKISTVVHAYIIHDRDTFSNAPSYPLFRLDYFAEKWEEMDGYVYLDEMYFRGGINGFDNMLIFSDDAKLYRVPSITNSTVDERNVSVSPVKGTLTTDYTVKFTNNYQGEGGTMITYMVGNTYPYANVMVEHAGGAGTSIVRDQASATVTGIRHIYDPATREESYFMEVWNGQKIVRVNITDENKLLKQSFSQTLINGASPTIPAEKTEIEIGDIIKYTLDESGNLSALALMYDHESKSLCYDTRGFGSEYNLSDGKVAGVRSNVIEVNITLDNSKTRWEVYNISALPTLIVDLKKNECYIGSSLDIEEGNDVLRYSRYSMNEHLTIYKY